MKIDILILIVTGFLIYNTYHDGKALSYFKTNKKYFEMGFYGFIGLCLYLLFKKKPGQSKQLLKQANGMIKYMPFDREAMSLFNPLIDMTTKYNDNFDTYGISGNEKRVMSSGRQTGGRTSGATKRSVSETKKKWVASQQNWTCKHCTKQLNAWFEVDHKIKLEHGGSNNVDNLVALCRECHGEKTAKERL